MAPALEQLPPQNDPRLPHHHPHEREHGQRREAAAEYAGYT